MRALWKIVSTVLLGGPCHVVLLACQHGSGSKRSSSWWKTAVGSSPQRSVAESGDSQIRHKTRLKLIRPSRNADPLHPTVADPSLCRNHLSLGRNKLGPPHPSVSPNLKPLDRASKLHSEHFLNRGGHHATSQVGVALLAFFFGAKRLTQFFDPRLVLT